MGEIIMGITRGGKQLFFAGADASDWEWTDDPNSAPAYCDHDIARRDWLEIINDRKRAALWFERIWIVTADSVRRSRQ